MLTTNRAKPTDLFNFQGLRKRVLIAPDYVPNDSRFASIDESSPIENEYEQLEHVDEEFEAYVRPSVNQNDWISERQHIRNEVNRLGDIIDFYDHKPNLNEFEKRMYKRLTRQDRSVQTEEFDEKSSKINRQQQLQYQRIPIIHLPPPLAMEHIEKFLADNHWRLVDLFRQLDKNKSWNIVKDDFRRLAEKDRLNISDAQIEELITCFCKEVQVPLDYKTFARGRSSYKKTIRSKTPSSLDTQLDTDSTVTGSSNHLQPPSNNLSNHYPIRDCPSSYSRSTASSLAKYKRTSTSTLGTNSKLSTYQ